MTSAPLQRSGMWAAVDGREYELHRSKGGVWHLSSWDPSDVKNGFADSDVRGLWIRPLEDAFDIDGFFRVGYRGRYRGHVLGAALLGDLVSVELITEDRELAHRLGMKYSYTFNQFVKEVSVDDPELMLEQVRTPASAPWETSK